MNETILVTGATGLLGSHVLYQLLQSGNKVRATYRSEGKRKKVSHIFSYYTDKPEELLQGVSWIKADLVDVSEVEDVMEGVSQVYHCAALVSFDDRDDKALMETNPKVTANIVNTALDFKVGKLVYVSSVAALGRATQGKPIDEKAQWVESANNSVYAKSKYLAELEVWRGVEEGLDAVIVNPSIILGPGEWESGSAAVFHTIGKGFKFYTKGVNAYVDARDVAEVMLKLMKSDISSERFVIVGENVSYKDLFKAIADEMGVPAPNIYAKPWMGNIVWRLEKVKSIIFGGKPVITKATARTAHQHNYYDNQKVRKALDFEFRPLDTTIREFCRFYKSDHSG